MPTPPDIDRVPIANAGPVRAGSGADPFYSTRLRQLMRIELDERRAYLLWRAVGVHRAELARRLGRDVGQRVALLDYVVNVSPQFVAPAIIEADELAAIERRALVDPLTGLFNRAYLDAALARETEQCRRAGTPSALMLLDLDGFKAVNDRLGHQRGDAVLRQVSGLLREQLRAADLPCRLGGDELAVILSGADLPMSLQVAERVRTATADAFADAPVRVTTSIGLAPLVVEVPRDGDPYLRADRALYAAKRGGGNRIVVDAVPAAPVRAWPS